MPRASSSTKLKRSSGEGRQGQIISWNNNIEDEDGQDEDDANLSNKLQLTQRQFLQSPSSNQIIDYDANENKDDEKIIFGDSKSAGGSMLIFDKIKQRSRILRQESIKSKNIQQSLPGLAQKDSKSVENNAATSTFHIEGNNPFIFPQNSMVMSENNIKSPKDDGQGGISMSINSLQNQGNLLSPGNKSSGNILMNQQPSKSHFASILKAHRTSISKSGTGFAQKDNGLFRNQTTKDGLIKMSSTMQSQVSILKKKKTFSEKVLYGGWNMLGKIFIILRFMKALKRSSIFYNYENLKKMHYQIIGDKAHVDKDEKDKLRKTNIMDQYTKVISPNITKISKSIKVFQPDNIWILLFYNVIIQFLTIFTAFYEMIISSFNGSNEVNISTPGYGVFRKAVSSIFFLEILIRFNTGTYREGIIIFSRDVIFKSYRRFQFFWVDIIIAIALISEIDNYIFSLAIFFLRCIKIWRLAQDFNDHFRIWYRFPTGWILAKLFFMIISLAHFWGCQFHYIAFLESEAGMYSWLQAKNLINEPWYIKYINSFYFTTISMITIGYGDIVPATTIEKCYATFVAVLGSCFFSYIVNTIGSIFQEISNKESAFKQQKNNITDYMAKRNINQKLQLKVIKYLDYTHTRQGDGPLKGQLILNSIAKNLREEVQLEYFGNILQNTRVFNNNFSQECLRALSLKFKEVMYGPGEVIFHKGELDYKIFFIQSGEVSLFLEKDGDEIFEMTKLNKGQMFGQFGFFGCKPREIAVKCCDITHLAYLEYEDFISVIKNYQEDYEKYYMMKDEINFKDKKLSTKCSSCGSFDHTIVDCSLVTPHFNKFRIVIKHIYPVLQKRQAIIRERIKFHTYQKNYAVREDLKRVRNNLALKFLYQGEIDEVSDENEYSDEYDNYPHQHQKQNQQIDDKDYFLKQKMQFRYVDGEIINYESENTHNYITDENQSLMADNLNQTTQTQNNQICSQNTLGKESSMNQSVNQDSVPDIIVQRKDIKQLSIIKNNYNPYIRSNSTVQKQSLFRMESLAALSSDIQRDEANSKGLGTAPQQGSYPFSGGFTSATGQTPKAGGQYKDDNVYQSDNKSQGNFYTQGNGENTSNVNSIVQNSSQRQADVSIGVPYLTQQNIALAQNTVDSTPHRSIDQSIDENKYQSTTIQQQKSHDQKKSSLTTEQLQQVREKLQMLNEKKKKKKKQYVSRKRGKKVSIQIEGQIMNQNESSLSYQSEDEGDDNNGEESPNHNALDVNRSWISDYQNYLSPAQKQIQDNHTLKTLEYKSPKSALSTPYPAPKIETFLICIKGKEQDYENEEDQQYQANKMKNKKIMSYQGEKIIERKSEQSMQDIEISSMTLVNNQLLTQKSRDNNSNSNHLISQKSKDNNNSNNNQQTIKEELIIDIDSLHQYESGSSPSATQQKIKNSLFFGFNRDRSGSNIGDLEQLSSNQVKNSPSPKLHLEPAQCLDEKGNIDDNYKLDELNESLEDDDDNDDDDDQKQDDHLLTPVKTPTHRRITIQAEKIFLSKQNSLNEHIGDQDSENGDANHHNPQQSNSENKTNFLSLEGRQLDPVQEILTKYSDELQNTSPNQQQINDRKLSIKSDIDKGSLLQSPLLKKSISSNNPKLTQYISSISNNNQNDLFISKENQNNYNDNSINYEIISNSSKTYKNQQLENEQYSAKKRKTFSNNQSEQQSQQSNATIQNPYNSSYNNYLPKENGQQINRQQSLSYMQNANYSTTDMRKLIAYNKANSKHFTTLQDEIVQGAALYGMHHYGQAPMNMKPKQYHPLQPSKQKGKNPNSSINQGNLNSPSQKTAPQSRKNAVYPPIADSFSQQVLYHQKYIQNKNINVRNSTQLQMNQQQQIQQQYLQQLQMENNHAVGGNNTPRKKQPTQITRFNTKGQFSSTYSQMNNNSNHTSFANAPRGRIPSWASNNQPTGLNSQAVNNQGIKPDSQTNLPYTDEQYEEDIIEFESVSNADLYIYDLDIMKEYKKYYPQHNFKKVLADCLRQRKPFISNKSIHNNTFIQKLMSKKKKIPRRLPSLMRQFDGETKKEEDV